MRTTEDGTTTAAALLLLHARINRITTSSRPRASPRRITAKVPLLTARLVRCRGGRERSGQGRVLETADSETVVAELALRGGSLGSSCFFLDGFEFVQEVYPADGVLIAGFQPGACWALEAGC